MATSTSQKETVPPSWWRCACCWLWHQQGFIWGTFLFGLFLNLLASRLLTKGFDPTGTPLGWLLQHPLLLLSGGFLLLTQLTLAWVGSRPGTSTSDTSLSSDQRSRAGILTALHKAYTEELASSLQGVARIALGLHERFDLTHPTRLTSWHPDQPERALPDGTSIVDAYDQAGRGLLILGAPGAGKTTLLYDLAQTLLGRADHDEAHPLPVVLNLSSWELHRGTLLEWAVKELELRYLIPHRLGQRWLQEGRFLLLLDGLDEVATSVRSVCLEAINTYHSEHLVSLVVCSRQEEYLTLSRQLTLQSAVIVQPLTFEQVKRYLSHLGRNLTAVRDVVRSNEVLQDLLTTPLMLSVVMLAYQGKTKKELPQTGGTEEQRTQIFASYLQRMLHIHEKHRTCSPLQMRQALVWLARQMQQRSQSVLYLERLQADWLATHWAQLCYVWLGVRLPGIVIGALVNFLIDTLFSGYSTVQSLLINVGLGAMIGGLFSTKLTLVSGRLFLRDRNHRLILVSITVLFGIGALLGTVLVDRQIGFSFGFALLDGTIWSTGIILLTLLLLLKKFSSTGEGLSTRPGIRAKKGRWHRLLASDYLGLGLLIGGLLGLLNGLSWGLAHGPSFGLAQGLSAGLYAGLSFGLAQGLSAGLLCLLLTRQSSTIVPTEILVWSWKNLIHGLLGRNHFKNTCLLAIGTLLIFGVSFELIWGVSAGLIWGVSEALSIAGSYWILVGLFQSVSGESFSEQQRTIPNQGIQRSARNGLLLGVLSGSISTLVSGLAIILGWLGVGQGVGLFFNLSYALSFGLSYGLSTGPVLGLAVGLLAALFFGWLAWWRHWVLRFLLWRERVISWHYVRLLDEASQRVLLRKSGGGYRFIHDLFRDYLASLEPAALRHASSLSPP